MKITWSCLMALGCCIAAGPTSGDVLTLKNGTVLNGTYSGGTSSTVKFDGGSGVQDVDCSTIVSLTFTLAEKSPPEAPKPAAPVSAQTQSLTLPAGTVLMVRMMDSVSSQNKPGTPFTAKLEYDLSCDKGVALKGGAVVYGKIQSSTQARRAVGQSTLDLRLTQVVINGKPVAITTSGFTQAGQRSGAKVAKGAAAGAAIGAVAGDAGKGAAIGAVAGGVIRGQAITIPPGTLLEFTLQQPLTLPAAT